MTTIKNSFPQIEVAGVPFRATTCSAAVEWLLSAVEAGAAPQAIRLANTYCVSLAHRRQEYLSLLRSAGVNFPDGAPVVIAMRALNMGRGPMAGRVRGPSFFREALQRGVSRGIRHYFLGGTPTSLGRLIEVLGESIPGIQVAGAYSPPFRSLDEMYIEELVEKARAADADVVWVGMGTPKQDFIAQAIADGAGKYAVGVGAAFDFESETLAEAPRWMQVSGLEWFFRLVLEPRRLWHRYVIHAPIFVLLVGRQFLMRKTHRSQADRAMRQTHPPSTNG